MTNAAPIPMIAMANPAMAGPDGMHQLVRALQHGVRRSEAILGDERATIVLMAGKKTASTVPNRAPATTRCQISIRLPRTSAATTVVTTARRRLDPSIRSEATPGRKHAADQEERAARDGGREQDRAERQTRAGQPQDEPRERHVVERSPSSDMPSPSQTSRKSRIRSGARAGDRRIARADRRVAGSRWRSSASMSASVAHSIEILTPSPSPSSATSTIEPLIPAAIASRTRSEVMSEMPGTRPIAARPSASGTRRLTTVRPFSRTSIRRALPGPSLDPVGTACAGRRRRARWPVGERVEDRAGLVGAEVAVADEAQDALEGVVSHATDPGWLVGSPRSAPSGVLVRRAPRRRRRAARAGDRPRRRRSRRVRATGGSAAGRRRRRRRSPHCVWRVSSADGR